MKDEFNLENEIAKVNREFGYPSPEPAGHHYCSTCRKIHQDGKCFQGNDDHWERDPNGGNWREK